MTGCRHRMTARWRDNMISLGVRRTRSTHSFRNHYSSKNISVLEIALIVSYLNRIFCLLRCSPHCHVFCALCYFIVVDTFSHCVALFSVTDSSSLIVIIRLFSKCKNDKPKTNGIFLVQKIYVTFPSQTELIKNLCFVTLRSTCVC